MSLANGSNSLWCLISQVVANILLFQADECLLLPTKIQWYYSALEFCRANQLHRREAVIHCRLFYLDHLGIHAENAICADPNYYEVNIYNSSQK